MLLSGIADAIGHTPLVQLPSPEPGAKIYGKLESRNPGGSVKDRAAKYIIQEAEKAGTLKPGGTIIEGTSGNTGIALSMLGTAKGYHVVIVMPDTMSVERQKLMKAYGAELVLTPGAEGMKGAVNKAKALAEEKGYFYADQFGNPANVLAHQETTAPEIIEQTDGQFQAFVAGVGTGGTITGVSSVLKEKLPEVKTVAVQPAASPVLTTGEAGSHKIQGLGANFVPAIYQAELVDEVLDVKDEDAFAYAKKLGQEAGIFVGISAGANYKAALEVAKKLRPEERVVVILPDTGERYLSTALLD